MGVRRAGKGTGVRSAKAWSCSVGKLVGAVEGIRWGARALALAQLGLQSLGRFFPVLGLSFLFSRMRSQFCYNLDSSSRAAVEKPGVFVHGNCEFSFSHWK